MKKIASGDGWFDLKMSALERDPILHALTFAVKNFDALDGLETPSVEMIKEVIPIFENRKRQTLEGDVVVRIDMSQFMTVSETLWSMLATIDADQIDLATLDPTLDVKKMRASKKAFNESMPNDQVTAELYPKDEQEFMRRLLEEDRKQNAKDAP